MCSTHAYEPNSKDVILELIKCPICLEIYTDPRMLPCQHSFCRCCLERLADNDGRWGRCPQCRQLFRIPFNGVGSFDVNRTIAQLLETFPRQQNERPALVAKCAGCKKEDKITTCDHCKEALCKPCRIVHFNEMKADMSKHIEKIDMDTEKMMIKEIESISKHELNLKKCKEIRQSIQKSVNEIIQKLKDEEAKLLDDVDDFERSETNFLTEKSERLKSLESMNEFSVQSFNVLSTKEETDPDVMEMSLNCSKFIEKLSHFVADFKSRYATRQINFVLADHDLGTILSLGYVQTTSDEDNKPNKSPPPKESAYIDLNSNEDKYETLEMQLKQQTPNNRQLSKSTSFNKRVNKFPSVSQIKDNSNVSKKEAKQRFKSIIEPRKFFQPYKIIGGEGEENSEFKHPLGVAVSPIDGFIYVADSWNNRIQVFDDSGVFVKSVEKVDQIEFHYPYSIHIDKKGRIYVSDQSLVRIKVLDSEFNLIRSIGNYGREAGCYSGLCDISTDAEDNIYVCDSGNHRILKFSESGEFISQWGSNGSEPGQFKCPACVTVHGERVIVSDWGNHRVQVFTLGGEFLSHIGKQGNGPSEFQRPLGVAIDEKGNIAIVDEGNNRLQIFKADFTYHSKISGLKCDFQRPWDVAITKQGGIVVSEYYGHRLQIL